MGSRSGLGGCAVSGPSEIEVREIVLDRLKVATRQAVSREALLGAAEVRTMLDCMTDRMIIDLTTYLLAHRQVDKRERITVTYPATWWDAFKRDLRRWAVGRVYRRRRRVFARLALRYVRRHPIRIDAHVVTVDFTEHASYPEAKIALPPDQFGRPVIIQQLDTQVVGYDDEVS